MNQTRIQTFDDIARETGLYGTLGHQPDNKMDRDDLEVFRQVGSWVEELTGYATVSAHNRQVPKASARAR